MMKVAIYCRLSEEDRNKQLQTDDSESIQNQKMMLRQYAEAHNWEIYDTYSDDDYTGSDRRRPEFNRLLSDAENRKFNIVLCKTQSRFTRELELVEKYIHGLFPVWGIRFVSIVDNADTDVKGNKKSRQINGLVNEWYLEDMSDNIKSVLTNRRVNGLHIGAFALYGYKKDPNQKGHLIIDEEAAEVVREVFTLFSQGYGKTSIAKLLNSRGIPNPTEYKRLKGLRYKQPKSINSTLWKYFTISEMLINEIYIGNMVQGKYGSVSYKTKINKPRPKEQWYIVKNTHEPIIDKALWDKVQSLISERAKPFSNGKIGIFARKLYCAECGYTLRSGHSNGYYYFTCPNRHVSIHSCEGAYVNRDKLEKRVLDEINSLCEKYINTDEIAKKVEWNIDVLDNKKKLIKEIAVYEDKIEEYSKGIRSIYMDKVKGIIREADYLEFSNEFEKEREALKQLISQNEEAIAELDAKLNSNNNRAEILKEYVHMDKLTREAVDSLIEKIIVHKRKKGEKAPKIEIYWNF